MKKLFGIGLLVLLSLSIKAQDTLYTRDGNKINAKIMEVTQSTISYKKTSNLDGPLYTSDKSDVVFVHYRNGSTEMFSDNNSYNSNNNNNTAVNNQPPQKTVNNYYPAQRPAFNVVVAPPVVAAPFYGWGGFGGYYGWGRPYCRSYYYRPHFYHHHGWH